ncbi:MAG: hypothetical protein V7609_607 [Verrucomicrobiota bacterium]
MKRDVDIVRSLLLRAEAADGSVSVNDPVETYHVRIMIDAGLVEGRISEEVTSDAPRHSHIHNLTWAGHDFLDAARSDTVWRTAKEKILRPGVSWTFELLKEILKELAKQQLARIGLPDLNT